MPLSKDSKREALRNLKEARLILNTIDKMLHSKLENKELMGDAFVRILNWHIQCGDLRPSEVHLAALLRGNNAGI